MKAFWTWAKRLAQIAFFAMVVYLLFRQLRSVQWDEVLATVRRRPGVDLLGVSALVLASYALYSCFDLLGRHVTGHKLPARRVMAVNFISYAFNLSMGAIIGSIAFRYRLYSRLGLGTETITRVLAMSILTNWLGYVLFAGAVFCFYPIHLPSDWKLGSLGLQVLGTALFSVVMVYVLLCALSRRRTWYIKGYGITLPSLRLALLQLFMSSTNWLLIAAMLFTLLEWKIAFPAVLGVMLVAAIAGVIAHVPGSLGVLEAVFLALLSEQISRSELLAALLTYRALYYLAPLAFATLLYLLMEARVNQDGAAQDNVGGTIPPSR